MERRKEAGREGGGACGVLVDVGHSPRVPDHHIANSIFRYSVSRVSHEHLSFILSHEFIIVFKTLRGISIKLALCVLATPQPSCAYNKSPVLVHQLSVFLPSISKQTGFFSPQYTPNYNPMKLRVRLILLRT